MNDEGLTHVVIGCAMTVHRVLGPGLLESVYQRAFAHELQKARIKVVCECPIKVMYDGINVGDYFADMLVEDRIIIENKAVQCIALSHEVQLVHYLTATELDIGLLFNFGSPDLQFRRKSRLYLPKRKNKNPGESS
jgi:GxxExxY protein